MIIIENHKKNKKKSSKEAISADNSVDPLGKFPKGNSRGEYFGGGLTKLPGRSIIRLVLIDITMDKGVWNETR